MVGAGVYAGNVDAHFADDTVTVDCELVGFGAEVSQLGGFVQVLGYITPNIGRNTHFGDSDF